MQHDESEKGKEAVFRETSARLLELAACEQTAFRSVAGALTAEQRGFMESVIFAGRSVGKDVDVDEDGEEGKEPTIALRMDFGG